MTLDSSGNTSISIITARSGRIHWQGSACLFMKDCGVAESSQMEVHFFLQSPPPHFVNVDPARCGHHLRSSSGLHIDKHHVFQHFASTQYLPFGWDCVYNSGSVLHRHIQRYTSHNIHPFVLPDSASTMVNRDHDPGA